MLPLSLLILVLLAALHLVTGHDFAEAISVELAGGNPLAWLLMAALCGMIFVFARRLQKNGHYVRTLLLLFLVVGLIVIAFSAYTSRLHETMLLVVTAMTVVWFSIAAVDYECHHLLLLSAVCVLLLPLVALFAVGIAEKGLILYSLYCTDVIYHMHLDPEGRTRW